LVELRLLVHKSLRFLAVSALFALSPLAAHAVAVTGTYTGDNVVGVRYCTGCTTFDAATVIPSGANAGDWRKPDSFAIDLAPGTYEFIFKVKNDPNPDAKNPGGFLAQISSGSTTVLSSLAWEVSLDGKTWTSPATQWAKNQGGNAAPYSNIWYVNNGNKSIVGIDTQAFWLWTENNFFAKACSNKLTANCTDQTVFFRVSFTVVPEPGALALLVAGLLGAGLARRRGRTETVKK